MAQVVHVSQHWSLKESLAKVQILHPRIVLTPVCVIDCSKVSRPGGQVESCCCPGHASHTCVVGDGFTRPWWMNIIHLNKTAEVKKLNLTPLTNRARFRRPSQGREAPVLDVPTPVS